MISRAAAAIFATVLFSCSASAGLVVFDFTSSGDAGDFFDDSPGGISHTQEGVTLEMNTSTTLGPTLLSEFNAISTNAGIDSLSTTTNDNPSGIDFGEELTFEITFDSTMFAVELFSVDWNRVGADSSDAAIFSLNKSSVVELHTGEANFNGTTDVWTPPNLSLTSGDVILLTATDEVGLQGITFNVTNVPEPTSLMCFLAPIVAMIPRRSRRTS